MQLFKTVFYKDFKTGKLKSTNRLKQFLHRVQSWEDWEEYIYIYARSAHNVRVYRKTN